MRANGQKPWFGSLLLPSTGATSSSAALGGASLVGAAAGVRGPGVLVLEVPSQAFYGSVSGRRRRSTQRRRSRFVLGERLFEAAIVRESKRAERFDSRFLLLFVEARAGGQPGKIGSEVVDALVAVTSPTDMVGWVERERAVGVIVPDAHGWDEPAIAALQGAVRRELARRVDGGTLADLDVRARVCGASPPVASGEAGTEHTSAAVDRPAARRPRRTAYHAVKRLLDVIGTLTLLWVLWPLFLVIAVGVRLTSPGPVLFRQSRVGRLGQPFTMLKFRTMRANADPALHHEFVTSFIRSAVQHHPAGKDVVYKLTKDPRVTPLGRILRKSSLDELPQLWNVLRGDMSLVGPRPPLAYEVEQYRRWHWRRVLEAKPGITGLWQVRGRSRTTFDEMVRLDLRYVRTCSVWTDLKILVATPRAVLSGKGAA